MPVVAPMERLRSSARCVCQSRHQTAPARTIQRQGTMLRGLKPYMSCCCIQDGSFMKVYGLQTRVHISTSRFILEHSMANTPRTDNSSTATIQNIEIYYSSVAFSVHNCDKSTCASALSKHSIEAAGCHLPSSNATLFVRCFQTNAYAQPRLRPSTQ